MNADVHVATVPTHSAEASDIGDALATTLRKLQADGAVVTGVTMQLDAPLELDNHEKTLHRTPEALTVRIQLAQG